MTKSEGKSRGRAIVTGSAGLLGRHVVRAFTAIGWSVTGIDQMAYSADPGVDAVAADLTSAAEAMEAIEEADCMVHCAAIPRPTGMPPEVVFDTNVTLMYNVISAVEAHDIKRLIFASSFSVLGLPFAPRPVEISSLPVDEDHPTAPQDVYAVSKWLGEEMLDAWVRRTGNRAVSLRLPWVQTEQSFGREVVPRRQTPEAALDLFAYVDARDAADAFVAAAESDIVGHHRLFISADDTYSEEPTEALVSKHMPDVALRNPLEEHTGLIDCGRAVETIGFRPRRSWRDYHLPCDEHAASSPKVGKETE